MTNVGEIPREEWPEALGVRAARLVTVSFVWRVVLVGALLVVSGARVLSSAGMVDSIPLDVQLLVVVPLEIVAFVLFWTAHLRAKKFAAIEYGVSPDSANMLAVGNRKKFLDSVVRARRRDLEHGR